MPSVPYHEGRFPPAELSWERLLPLIGPASAAIAKYEGVLHGVPNPNVLLSPLTVQEAVLSSRIEGTQATLGEVLEFEAAGDLDDEGTQKKADIHEVLNYRAALRLASDKLDDLPLSQRLIKQAHQRLMAGVRGRNKSPGDYRRIPNWIRAEGCTIEQARYIPCGADKLQNAMDRWERYIHDDAPDRLVQLAIVHAEFEAIHPFLDGNGRLGRLIIPLFLKSKGLLSRPNFYISEHLEARRDEYYARLLAVSDQNDWTGWCEFFLRAVIEQAKINQERALAILNLYKDRKEWAVDVTRSTYAVRALDWCFSRPVFKVPDFVGTVEIPRPTATRIVRLFKEHGLLRELRPGKGRRPAILAFSELLNIAEGRTAF